MSHVTAVQPGAGASLAYSTTLGGTYTPVGLGVEITGPAPTVEKIDTSVLVSTVKTSRPGVPDPGDLGLKGWYDPADTSHVALTAALWAGTVLFWKLTYGDIQATVDAFTGYLTEFARSGINIDSNLEFDMKIAVTDLITTTHTNPTL